jgi:hypothetical protein
MADDITISFINSIDDCLFMQSHKNSEQNWRTLNHMKLNVGKIKVISFSKKSSVLPFNSVLYNSGNLHADCIKDLDVFLDSKHYFHQLIDYLVPRAMKC